MDTQSLSQLMGATSSTVNSGGKSVMGKDDFLKLLVTQLRNQDPLSPMNGSDFAAQLAQFSSVEQLSNINSTLTQSVSANQVLTQSISNALAATFIGKEVRASTNTFSLSGTGEVKLGYTLASAADTVTVKLKDGPGVVVRTIQVHGTDKGDNTFTWDGKDDNGQSLAAGTYKFEVGAVDAKGKPIGTSGFAFGSVSAVRFKSNGTFFVVDGLEIPLSDILEIMNG